VHRLHGALSAAAGPKLLDIGAGTGNYSEALAELGWSVTAAEPSAVMRSQRRSHARLRWVGGYAESLPVAAQSLDAVVCVSALHHLINREQAFAEMSRVVGGGPLVVFTRDPRVAEPCWLEEYFPEVWAESYTAYPDIERVSAELRRATGRMAKVELFELPGYVSDYFAAAGWSRPELYLDERVRAGMSPFVRTASEFVKAGVERLRADLSSGLWDKRYGSLRQRSSFNAGYYLLTAL
jgi:SAM-dependent methyltransferase